ncbi:MAG: DUF4160 domain-containing protein [Nocardiopsaceae bacterium]|jgi:hypothetical protein|nr:DUF4160 domain-containing protein [Nocardiopsaceae bacterium]
MPLGELHKQVASIALHAAAGHRLALGGSNALIAHGLIQRPTLDLDLFTDQEHGVEAAAVLGSARPDQFSWRRGPDRRPTARYQLSKLPTVVAGGSYGHDMPRISAFYGVVIYMYWNERDHPVAHFRAYHAGRRASVSLDGTVLAGSLEPRALGFVRDWAKLHQAELVANWERARRNEPLLAVPPLP